MAGIIGKKIGMTSVYSAEGKNLPCTIIEAGPCVVTQIKTQDKDGYESVQLGFDDKKEKNTPKAMVGHFSKAKTTPKRKIVEFKGFQDVNLGDAVTVEQFQERVSLLMLQEHLKVKVSKVLLRDMALVVLVKQPTDNTIE